jgi:hypothetical protein
MKTWLYLARRDKKGLKLLAIFSNTPFIPATRVQDIKTLHLSQELETELVKTTFEQRMLWELWIETAESYDSLKKAMRVRGYSNLPMQADAIHTPRTVVMDKKDARKVSKSNNTKTMLRKRK